MSFDKKEKFMVVWKVMLLGVPFPGTWAFLLWNRHEGMKGKDATPTANEKQDNEKQDFCTKN